MTPLIQTVHNYSLKPLAELILEALGKLNKAWIAALEAEGLKRAQVELRKYRTYRETYDQLSRLSDRELKDLGISRSMIHSVALEVYTNDILDK